MRKEKRKIKKEKNTFPIGVIMTTYSIILLMYIFTYGRGLKVFWAFFVIERLLGWQYEDEIEGYFFKLDQALERTPEGPKISPARMLSIVLCSILGVGIYLYTPFKYPGLFVILLIGEVIDFLLKRIKRKIKLK